MEKTELKYDVAGNIEEARNNLKISKEAFERSPNYTTAQALQIHQRQFDAFIADNRSSWVSVEGSKGGSAQSSYEIALAALQEIEVRARELRSMDVGSWVSNEDHHKRIKYLHDIAMNALIDIGLRELYERDSTITKNPLLEISL